jgi:hypothetical protein
MSKIRNYDIDLLTFWIAEPGFVLGEGILGVNKLGGDEAPVQIDMGQFYSMMIDSPDTVDGVFVHREVRRLTLNAKVTAPVNYDGKRIIVKYDAVELFYGTVREYDIQESWTEAVDTPEGIPYREYTVTITAMSGEERFANTPTPDKNFNGQTMTDRVTSYLGTSTYMQIPDSARDINYGLAANAQTASVGHLVYASDDMPSLLESIRSEMRLMNYHYIYEPWNSNVILRTNSRWLGPDGADESSALTFTDNPADIVVTGGDTFVHDGNVVGYTQRSLGKNSSYFIKGVTITMTNSSDVTTTYGPYRASSAFPQDVDINIGRQSSAGEALAKKIASTLPLRSRDEQFTYRIRTKLQSRKQMGLDGEGPGMAVLKSQGTTQRIAILGVTHTVTRDEWTVEYACGPEHLISRESDKQPFIVTDFSVTENVPGVQWKFEWTTPDLNSNVPLYAIIYSSGPDGVGPGEIYRGAAKAPGVVEDIFISGFASGFYTFYVYYTNNPTAGDYSTSYIYSPGSASQTLLIF